MLGGVKLAPKIGGKPALAQFELDIMPGAAVEDDQLADVIASNLASHGHQTATAPIGRSPVPVGGRGLAQRPKGIDAPRAADALIMPVAPSVATNLTTIMIAERIANAFYATDGHLAVSRSSKSRRPAAAAASSHNHRNQVTAAHLDGH